MTETFRPAVREGRSYLRTVGISPAEGETFVTALAHRIG